MSQPCTRTLTLTRTWLAVWRGAFVAVVTPALARRSAARVGVTLIPHLARVGNAVARVLVALLAFGAVRSILALVW